jgi:uncharacterized Zn finger protein (UPF0148 family)
MKQEHPNHLGPDGACVCPGCGYRVQHQAGLSCREMNCPNCGRKLLREDGEHYRAVLEKQQKKERP